MLYVKKSEDDRTSLFNNYKKNPVDTMININNPADCCGCTACASICAHDAITMKPDALGFLYPEVDRSKCVDCGLCEKVCAFNDDYDKSLNIDNPLAYAARHKNEEELRYSRSGAVFVAMSDYILEHGGVVMVQDMLTIIESSINEQLQKKNVTNSREVSMYRAI